MKKFRSCRLTLVSIFLLLGSQSQSLFAEVDKVYHPYVEYDRWEFESRLISRINDEYSNDFAFYRLGFGKDISEKLFLEFYAIGKKDTSAELEIEAYEIEALYQIGEQGQYWADWGVLVEIERENESREWEANIGILVEKEFGRWSGAFNFHRQYDYQDDVSHSWSNNTALQFRYRQQPLFEPGLEIYTSSGSFAIGPVFLGEIKFNNSKINWEIGALKEMRTNGPQSVLRAVFEYEF